MYSYIEYARRSNAKVTLRRGVAQQNNNEGSCKTVSRNVQRMPSPRDIRNVNLNDNLHFIQLCINQDCSKRKSLEANEIIIMPGSTWKLDSYVSIPKSKSFYQTDQSSSNDLPSLPIQRLPYPTTINTGI